MKTREEEITENAYIYESVARDEFRGTLEAFKAGAHWADAHPQSPWISTHKSLPKAIDILDYSDMSKIKWCLCHTKEAYQTYFVGYYAVSIDDEHKVWCNIRGEEVCGPYDVDYYIPLPELPKGGRR